MRRQEAGTGTSAGARPTDVPDDGGGGAASLATRASYALVFLFGLCVGLPGPAVPSLQDDYGLSYGGAALHLTVFSAGSALGSFLDDRIARLGSRAAVLRGALLGTAVAAVACALAPSFAVSLVGVAVMGACATVGMNTAHGVLGAEHGRDAATPLATAHLFGAVGLAAAAAVVGLARSVDVWRISFAGPALVVAALLALRIPARLPTAGRRTPDPAGTSAARVPLVVWIGGLLLALSVTVEWAVMFWAPSYLRDPIGLPERFADVTTVAVLATMVVGRLTLLRLTRRHRAMPLLRVVFIATAVASVPYLAGPSLAGAPGVVVPVAGLAALCLLVTMLFPLGLTATLAAVGSSAEQQQRASAVALGTSGALTIAGPYLLGAAADATTLTTALGILPVGAALALGTAAWLRRRAEPAAA